MFKKNKKKEVQKPTVFTTSSVTRTENTITTANGLMKTTQIVRTSYQERSITTAGGSNFTRLTSDRSSFPKLRSAFDEPVHNYQLKKPLPSTVALSSSFSNSSELRPPLKFETKPAIRSLSASRNGGLSKPLETRPALKFDAKPFIAPPLKITSQPLQSNTVINPNAFNNELNTQLKVIVKATGRYYDGNSKIPTYETRSPKKRGRLLLINNIEFKGKRREGADVDHKNIIVLFKQIGFEIVEHKNKRKAEIERIVRNFAADKDLKKCDICITVIMSHGTTIGERTMIETIDEQILETEWVVQQFDGINCRGMSGKPKIFIFQCCRGENENANLQTDATMFQKPRQVQDILISYSTIPGFVAYRDPKLGSWYIQGLCKVFMEHSHDTHIEDLLKIVDAELAKLNAGSQRQTSSYENRGFKTCYLHPIGN